MSKVSEMSAQRSQGGQLTAGNEVNLVRREDTAELGAGSSAAVRLRLDGRGSEDRGDEVERDHFC